MPGEVYERFICWAASVHDQYIIWDGAWVAGAERSAR
jgi:hypothetical protein